jgi:hypothetical protein
VQDGERGTAGYDPHIEVSEDDSSLNIAISQCRGLTSAGCIVEIGAHNIVRRRFEKPELEGLESCRIYLVCDPNKKEALEQSISMDEANPQMRAERCANYRVKLQVHADEAPFSLAVGQIRRLSSGVGFEKNTEFIPACVSMSSFSVLTAVWRQLTEQVEVLSRRYCGLYEAMQEYSVRFREHDLETEDDVRIAIFVGRMVTALQTCLYEILDPTQQPARCFGHFRKFIYGSAVDISVSRPVQQYFELLKSSGETEYSTLLSQQTALLQTTPKWQFQEDLGVEARKIKAELAALSRLEAALEGKYIDFRVNRAVDSMNFIFDRGGEVLYRLVTGTPRVQSLSGTWTMVFASLKLEGRARYRLLLVGDKNNSFEVGTKIAVEIKINEGSAYKRSPIYLDTQTKVSGQCNVEFDFDSQELGAITDVRVSVPSYVPVRTAMLFVRQFFLAPKESRLVPEPRLTETDQKKPELAPGAQPPRRRLE